MIVIFIAAMGTSVSTECERVGLVGHVARIISMINSKKMYAVKTERNKPVERPRNRREGSVKVDRNHMEFEGVECGSG